MSVLNGLAKIKEKITRLGENRPMKILAIETSGKSFGVALRENGKTVREAFSNSVFCSFGKTDTQYHETSKKRGMEVKRD